MVTREQYDNAVKIRDNGYRCSDLGPNGLSCCKSQCFDSISFNCGSSSEPNGRRKQVVDDRISTYETEHPEDFGPGEGWRWLKPEADILCKGDENYFRSVEFRPINPELFGQIVKLQNGFRRRISKPRIYTYEDVNLPEVQALVGKMVYVCDCYRKINEEPENQVILYEIKVDKWHPFIDKSRNWWQFIRAIDPIRLTRAELIAIAAKARGVNPEQIVVEDESK
jgi:hypothetical protein